jgi:hypothetical protein
MYSRDSMIIFSSACTSTATVSPEVRMVPGVLADMNSSRRLPALMYCSLLHPILLPIEPLAMHVKVTFSLEKTTDAP